MVKEHAVRNKLPLVIAMWLAPASAVTAEVEPIATEAPPDQSAESTLEP